MLPGGRYRSCPQMWTLQQSSYPGHHVPRGGEDAAPSSGTTSHLFPTLSKNARDTRDTGMKFRVENDEEFFLFCFP